MKHSIYIYIIIISVIKLQAQDYSYVDDGHVDCNRIEAIEYLGDGIAVFIADFKLYQLTINEDFNFKVDNIVNPFDQFTKLVKIVYHH